MTTYRTACMMIVIRCLCSVGMAQGITDTLWQSAQDAYMAGDYEGAVRGYEDFLVHKPASYAAMYNLGNSYLQRSDLGKAILWYERAKLLKPNDDEILLNLTIAKARRENPVVEIHEFFLMRWMRFWSGLMSVMAWGIVSLLCFWIAVGCIIWKWRTGAWGMRRWITGIAFVGFVFAGVFGAQRYHDFTSRNFAIVIQHEVLVRIAPDEESKTVSEIGAGEKVLIRDSLNAYYKIRLANFEQGWIAAESLEKI